MEKKAPMPIGIEFYKEMIAKKYYYIDKTLLIRDLLEYNHKVTLFTRPRRFGKTLAQSMVKTFFEKEILADGTEADNSVYFQGKKIMGAGRKYLKHMGQYPVIFLSLKSAKQPAYEIAYEKICDIIAGEFMRHCYVLEGDTLFPGQKREYCAIMERTASVSGYATAVYFLSKCLEKYHKQRVVILVDEYDVPLENAYLNGFYEQMASFVRSLFESAFKTNESLEFAIVTGCLRISKESIFTGLNNFKTMTISDRAFSKYFGFTDEEVKEMLCYYGIEEKCGLFKKWYNGYRFGGNSIYCPWDVINQCSEFCESSEAEMKPHWINSSSNYIIKDILDSPSNTVKRQLEELVSGECIRQEIIPGLVYPDLKSSDSRKRQLALWSVLYTTGYLTDAKEPDGNIHTLVIPNREIQEIYQKQILEWFIGQAEYSIQWNSLCKAVENGNAKETEKILDGLLKRFISIKRDFL